MKNTINFYFIFYWLRIFSFRLIMTFVVFIAIVSCIKGIKNLSGAKNQEEVFITEKIREDQNPIKEEFRTKKIMEEKKNQDSEPENFLIKRLNYFLGEIENVEHLIAIIGLIILSWDAPTQRKRTHYEAWQVINSAQKQGGSGGRIKALEYLNNEQESMAGLTANNTDLKDTNLKKADLFGAEFENTYLNNSNLSRANLREAKLSGAKLIKANLYKANLSRANLTNAKLIDADLRWANLSGADVSHADLINAKLNYADLTTADFKQADLRNANLCCVKFNRTDLTKANLCRTDLRDSELKGTIFVYANLWYSDLSSNVKVSNLQKADFTRAILRFANLEGADFRNANLRNADISYANLKGAKNLTIDQVKAANNWDKAIYDPEFRQELGLHVLSTDCNKEQKSWFVRFFSQLNSTIKK